MFAVPLQSRRQNFCSDCSISFMDTVYATRDGHRPRVLPLQRARGLAVKSEPSSQSAIDDSATADCCSEDTLVAYGAGLLPAEQMGLVRGICARANAAPARCTSRPLLTRQPAPGNRALDQSAQRTRRRIAGPSSAASQRCSPAGTGLVRIAGHHRRISPRSSAGTGCDGPSLSRLGHPA